MEKGSLNRETSTVKELGPLRGKECQEDRWGKGIKEYWEAEL